jgi:hypothetical protein
MDQEKWHRYSPSCPYLSLCCRGTTVLIKTSQFEPPSRALYCQKTILVHPGPAGWIKKKWHRYSPPCPYLSLCCRGTTALIKTSQSVPSSRALSRQKTILVHPGTAGWIKKWHRYSPPCPYLSLCCRGTTVLTKTSQSVPSSRALYRPKTVPMHPDAVRRFSAPDQGESGNAQVG